MKTIKKIKDLVKNNKVKITKGRHYPSPSKSQFWDHKNGYLWLKIGDIKPYTFDSQCKLSFKGIETIKNAQDFLFKKDSFVLATTGSVGKIGWLKNDFYSSTAIVNFDCIDLILKKYLYYFFIKNRKKIFSLKIGTAMPSVKLWQIENLEINLPYQQIQKEIVVELDLWSNQQKIIKDKIIELKKFFRLRLFQIFNDYKNNNFNYQKKFIKDLVKIIKGRHYPSPSKSQFWDHKNGFLWLKIGDIKPYTYNSQCKLSREGIATIKNAQCFLFKKDSFVMGIDGVGSIGKLGWLEKDCFSSTHLINFNCDDLILKKYLYYFFKKNRKKIEWFQNGTTGLKSIKLWQIENLKINLPDRQIQKEIVEELDLFSRQIRILTQKEAKYSKLIKLIIHKKIK